MADPSTLTQLHRRQQLAIRKATIEQLATVWPSLSWADLDGTYERLAAGVGRLVVQNRQTSAAVSAAYLRAHRSAARIPGRPVIITPDLAAEQFTTALHVTTVVQVKKAAARGVLENVAMAAAFNQASGAMARLVLNGGRETVVASTGADPRARGWARVLGGGGCDFCQMLAGRGDVYSEETASFEAHDRCGCTAEPSWG